MNADTTDEIDAYPSHFETEEPSGSATTANGQAASELTPLTERHLKAIETRGLDPELLATLGVGASDRLRGDCIGIPYFDGEARVATKYRTLTGEKRFTQDAGGRQIFWNLNCLRDASLAGFPVIITEGELDAVAALQAGFPRTVSVPGGAPSEPIREGDGGKKYAFIEEAKAYLAECREIILAVDGDAKGANLLHDLAVRLNKARCKWVTYPKGCKDLNDALKMYGERGVQQAIQRAQWCKVSGLYRMSDLPPLTPPPPHDIGIVGLEAHYRIRLGDFAVVTGIPGHGKSSFVNEVSCRMAQRHGWSTVFASFEQMPQTDHRRALRSFWASKREAEMTDEQLAQADAWIDRHFSFIIPHEDEDITLEWVLQHLAAAVIRNNAKIGVIDPWNEMDHIRPPDMNMTEYTGFAIKEMKKFAKKYRIHLMVLAHPAKMQRDRQTGKIPKPSLYDISDSAHWNNKPDVGIVIHRESYDKPEASITVVKSRYHSEIGRPGAIYGIWNQDTTRYTIADAPELL